MTRLLLAPSLPTQLSSRPRNQNPPQSSYDTVLNMQCDGFRKKENKSCLWSICIYFHSLTCGNVEVSVHLPLWEQLWCSCVFCVLHNRVFVGSVGELGQIKNAAERRGWDGREWQVRGRENTPHIPPRHHNNSLCVFFCCRKTNRWQKGVCASDASRSGVWKRFVLFACDGTLL